MGKQTEFTPFPATLYFVGNTDLAAFLQQLNKNKILFAYIFILSKRIKKV